MTVRVRLNKCLINITKGRSVAYQEQSDKHGALSHCKEPLVKQRSSDRCVAAAWLAEGLE